jgi:hypothetical protein
MLALVSMASSSATAQGTNAKVELRCHPEAAPGRVICELVCDAAPTARLAWLDALVTHAPDFVKPLRARVSAPRALEAASGERKLSLALVATRGGIGELGVTARLVLCLGHGRDERCFVERHPVVATVRVGS